MMTRIMRIFSALCICTLVFASCAKKAKNIPPEPDTEVETAIDAMWATYVITDIDQICSFLGVGEVIRHYYVTTVARHPGDTSINIGFNQTKCLDGRMRDGTIILDFKFDPRISPGPDPHAEYYQQYRFA